jgi:hypothetical protein
VCTYLGVYVGDLLDRTALSRSTMASPDNAAIGALAELLDKGILGINDKGAIKRLK